MSDPSERRRRIGKKQEPVGTTSATMLGLISLTAPIATIAISLSAANRMPTGQVDFNIGITLFIATIFLVVLLFNALFVGSDIAVELLKSVHIKLFEPDSKESTRLQFIHDNKESVIAACVLGATTMRTWLVLMCFVPGFWLAGRFGLLNPELESWKMALNVFWVSMAVTLPVMGINIAFAEVPAKTYASVHPEKVCRKLYRFLIISRTVFMPFNWLATSVAKVITHRFGTDPRFEVVSRAEEEIKDIIDTSSESGEIDEHERELLESVFEFGDMQAEDVMTPRVDVESVPKDAQILSVAQIVEATGFSRFPVYEENDDNIVGVIHAKDILRSIAVGQTERTVESIMRKPLFTTESRDLHGLLQEMRSTKNQLVIVLDEAGGTAGIVTIEDIVEELVGDIVDEYDDELPDVVKNGSAHLVLGNCEIDDLNDKIGSEFESEEFDTIGGYVFGLFGRQPSSGESINDGDYIFSVEDTDGRRILRVKVEKLSKATH